MHHSDQGVEYAATGYIQLLEATQVQISMAAVGRPTENASVERLMLTLKEEEVYLHEYRDLEDARQQIGRFLDEVNMHKRVHSALSYVPPAEYEAQWYAEHPATRQTSGSDRGVRPSLACHTRCGHDDMLQRCQQSWSPR
jgi:transposase InsO family protein